MADTGETAPRNGHDEWGMGMSTFIFQCDMCHFRTTKYSTEWRRHLLEECHQEKSRGEVKLMNLREKRRTAVIFGVTGIKLQTVLKYFGNLACVREFVFWKERQDFCIIGFLCSTFRDFVLHKSHTLSNRQLLLRPLNEIPYVEWVSICPYAAHSHNLKTEMFGNEADPEDDPFHETSDEEEGDSVSNTGTNEDARSSSQVASRSGNTSASLSARTSLSVEDTQQNSAANVKQERLERQCGRLDSQLQKKVIPSSSMSVVAVPPPPKPLPVTVDLEDSSSSDEEDDNKKPIAKNNENSKRKRKESSSSSSTSSSSSSSDSSDSDSKPSSSNTKSKQVNSGNPAAVKKLKLDSSAVSENGSANSACSGSSVSVDSGVHRVPVMPKYPSSFKNFKMPDFAIQFELPGDLKTLAKKTPSSNIPTQWLKLFEEFNYAVWPLCFGIILCHNSVADPATKCPNGWLDMMRISGDLPDFEIFSKTVEHPSKVDLEKLTSTTSAFTVLETAMQSFPKVLNVKQADFPVGRLTFNASVFGTAKKTSGTVRILFDHFRYVHKNKSDAHVIKNNMVKLYRILWTKISDTLISRLSLERDKTKTYRPPCKSATGHRPPQKPNSPNQPPRKQLQSRRRKPIGPM